MEGGEFRFVTEYKRTQWKGVMLRTDCNHEVGTKVSEIKTLLKGREGFKWM